MITTECLPPTILATILIWGGPEKMLSLELQTILIGIWPDLCKLEKLYSESLDNEPKKD